jgi:hypothetical protein
MVHHSDACNEVRTRSDSCCELVENNTINNTAASVPSVNIYENIMANVKYH